MTDADNYEPWRISRYLPQCARAVLRQRDRVIAASDDDHEMEMHLYVIAIAHLHDIVSWASQGASCRAQSLLAASKDSRRVGNADEADALLALSRKLSARCSTIDKTLRKFDEEAPHVKDVRDIHEHIEAYEQGVGEIQLERLRAGFYEEHGNEVPPLSIFWSGGTVHVMGFEVNASTSAPAAELLARAVVAALG